MGKIWSDADGLPVSGKRFGTSALASVSYPKIVISLCVIPIDADSLAISSKRVLYPARV